MGTLFLKKSLLGIVTLFCSGNFTQNAIVKTNHFQLNGEFDQFLDLINNQKLLNIADLKHYATIDTTIFNESDCSFRGRAVLKLFSNKIKLVCIKQSSLKYSRDIFLTYNEKNIQIDNLIILCSCERCEGDFKCKKTSFISKAPKNKIKVYYYYPSKEEGCIYTKDSKLFKTEIQFVDTLGKFGIFK